MQANTVALAGRAREPQLPMGLAQRLPVRRGMRTRSTSSTMLSFLIVQALSILQTLAIPRRRSANTPTLRETVDQHKRLTCLHPDTRLMISRAMPRTSKLLIIRTILWCDGVTLTPGANGRITKPCIVTPVTYGNAAQS
jgi:hypothetical protein